MRRKKIAPIVVKPVLEYKLKRDMLRYDRKPLGTIDGDYVLDRVEEDTLNFFIIEHWKHK